MDLRIEKTKSAITNTFLALRAEKPIEKITIKELCSNAKINKSTFYSHYKDIYDLSEQLENEVIASVMNNISGPEQLFEDPVRFTQDLFLGYLAADSLIQLLFSGTRRGELVGKIERHIKEMLFNAFPELLNDPMKNMIISHTIYGSYYAFIENRKYGDIEAIHTISRIVEVSVKYL